MPGIFRLTCKFVTDSALAPQPHVPSQPPPLDRMASKDAKEEDKNENSAPPLDEEDITLLKSYVRSARGSARWHTPLTLP